MISLNYTGDSWWRYEETIWMIYSQSLKACQNRRSKSEAHNFKNTKNPELLVPGAKAHFAFNQIATLDPES